MALKDCCIEWHKNVAQVFCSKKEFIDPEEVYVFDQFCPECGRKITQEGVELYREG